MPKSRIGGRYARALFATTKGSQDKAAEHLKALKAMGELFGVREVAKVLKSPTMPVALKREVLTHAITMAGLQGDAAADMRGFLEVLLAARRVADVPMIAAAYDVMYDDLVGVARAQVESAMQLDPVDVAEIKKALAKATGRQIISSETIDAELLGGFVVRIANSVIDFSLRSKLEALAQHVVQ